MRYCYLVKNGGSQKRIVANFEQLWKLAVYHFQGQSLRRQAILAVISILLLLFNLISTGSTIVVVDERG